MDSFACIDAIVSRPGMWILVGMDVVKRAGMDVVKRAGMDVVERAGMDVVERVGMDVVERVGMDVVERVGMVKTHGPCVYHMYTHNITISTTRIISV